MARQPGYDQSMNTRITVSLPEHLVERARQAVAAGQAASVSAYVAGALEEKTGAYTLKEVLDEWAAEAGPPTPEEDAWVAEAMRIAERAANR